MESIETGHGKLRSNESRRSDEGLFGEPPEVRITQRIKFSYGAQVKGIPACGKCGCEFVNVGCPKHWPVETVALTCAKCGSVVEYVDGLLVVTVKEYLREYVNKPFGVERFKEISFGAIRELIFMGHENNLSVQDIAEALEVSEEYVNLILGRK